MNASDLTRRDFLGLTAIGTAALRFRPLRNKPAAGIVCISSANGLETVKKAHALASQGIDPLDAAIAGVNLVEEDPNDTSVGYGGLPNEEGVVQLDSCVMHGPKSIAGAVAAIENIKYPSRVARLVAERTDHCLIVGKGATRFARAHGFQEENLLTEKARKRWLRWKENLSTKDDWLSKEQAEGFANEMSDYKRDPGTIHCGVRTASGDFGSVTTTSGLAFKIPGRVGDSPLIGCGNYLDNEIGSCGSTGRGEAVIVSNGAAGVVDAMRRGLHPTEACLEILKRIAKQTRRKYLLDQQGRPHFDVKFYAIRKDGEFGGAALWSGAKFAVATGEGARLEKAAFLFQRRK